ncbi:hypothetical protein ACP179_00570 (plasmid) [Xenorhabdus stockiae]|uniref:hypothetical protein n=1 Tax=Xenorhabdus stockiae TaxID=351614 RepID=UPI003CEF42E7
MNGRLESGELFTLPELGIEKLFVNFDIVDVCSNAIFGMALKLIRPVWLVIVAFLLVSIRLASNVTSSLAIRLISPPAIIPWVYG